MDIIETLTEAASETKQLEVHLARVAKYREEGYPVVEQPDGSIWVYPKNALTGEPNMNAQPTELWAAPSATLDETFEIPVAPDVSPTYSGTMETDYTLRSRPPEWQDPEAMEGTEFNAQYMNGEFK